MPSLLRRWLPCLVLVLGLPAAPAAAKGGAQEPPPARADETRAFNERYPLEFRKRVNASIERGIAWLLTQQQEDGSWPSGHAKAYPMGPTALAVLTLLKGGVKPDHPAVKKAFAYLRPLPMRKTYSVGVLLMALDARYAPARDPFEEETLDRYGRSTRKDPCLESIDKDGLAWMKEGVRFLLEHQTSQGVWRYPSKQDYDLSCTQYALLGLKAAVRCGIKIPASVWLGALRFMLDHQEADGEAVSYRANEVRGDYRIAWTEPAKARGFRYRKPNAPVTGSMTTAGLAGLIICQSELWQSRRFDGKLRLRTRTGIRDAMAWLQVHFDVLRNPVQRGPNAPPAPPDALRGGPNHHYYLYGLERASMLGRIRHYGKTDWYEDGAELLMHDQLEDGAWPLSERVVESCFAILFLKRATTRMKVPVITHRGGEPKDTRAKADGR